MKIHLALTRKVWFAVFGVALLLAFGWVATTSGPLAPIKVIVTQVVQGEVAPALFGIGTVEAQRAYLIGPLVAGRVKRVLVDVGATVKAGQLLAEMEPVDLDKRVASAAAAVDGGRSTVKAAEAQLSDAKSRRQFASVEAVRALDLGKSGASNQSEVDVKVLLGQSADAQLAAAEAGLAAAREGLTRLEADLGGAEQQRENLRLSAPVDGVVTSREAEPGSTVVAGQAVLKLMDPASVWVTVRLDQGRSAGLRMGLSADITLRSDSRKPFAGKVARVEPISDSVTEERVAKVAFEHLPPDASVGEMADVTLRLPTVGDALIVPNASVRHRGVQVGVWVRAEGKLRFAPVKTGAEGLDGTTQILEGLRVGEEVIVYSERDLKDDSRIKVVTSLGGIEK
jgi:HlyD family secretion protein